MAICVLGARRSGAHPVPRAQIATMKTVLALAAGVLCDTADSWTAAEKPTDPAKELERV